MALLELEFLKECAIESTKDDFENIATLELEIKMWAEEEGKAFSTDSLLAALDALVREGRLGAYRYAVDQGKFVESPFHESAIADLWFKFRE
jgi:hypothetical protein